MTNRRVAAVAHLVWSGEVGGIERLVRDLAAQQARDDLTVTVAFGQRTGPFSEEAGPDGPGIVDLRLRSGYDVSPSRVQAGVAAVREADVLHLHGYNLAFAVMCRRAGRPVVFTEHGNFGIGRKIGPTQRVKRRFQASFLRRRVARIVANSSYTAERVRDRYGIAASSITVVHNGIDVAWLDAGSGGAQSAPEHDHLSVATVGRLVAFKRIDRVIEALARATKRERISLEIIGDGPLAPALRSLATSLSVDNRIRFAGASTCVAETLATVDVLVQPSIDEPFGLAILEACAQGALPIVFADGGGALEVIPPDGVVVEDVDQLASALDALVGSAALASDARRRRAAWVRERFPIARTAAGYLDVYESAVVGGAK